MALYGLSSGKGK